MWPPCVMEIAKWLSLDVIQLPKEIGLSMCKNNLMTKRSRYKIQNKTRDIIWKKYLIMRM